jgi:hypothetical protein
VDEDDYLAGGDAIELISVQIPGEGGLDSFTLPEFEVTVPKLHTNLLLDIITFG